MAAKGMQFRWRWNGGTISLNLAVIWEMSVVYKQKARALARTAALAVAPVNDGADDPEFLTLIG